MSPQGFASLSPERRAKVSSKGGRAAHQQGKAHQWSASTAEVAAERSAARRRQKALQTALERLREAYGADVDAYLSADEILRYGGCRRSPNRFKELSLTLQARRERQG